MGVQLTQAATRELDATATRNQIVAQVNLAHGVTAQRHGTEVAALSYYFLAEEFDPTLLEAVNRSVTLNLNIRTGNIGADVRNDIAWRTEWVNTLSEVEQVVYGMLSSADPPYTFFYTPDLQQGNVNYQRETVDISFPINLRTNGDFIHSTMRALERFTQSYYDGLHATGRANTWGLTAWPNTGMTNNNPFNRRWDHVFNINIELQNQQNRVIGRTNFNETRTIRIERNNNNRIVTRFDVELQRRLNFQNVNSRDITDNLSIRITSVNGANPETARFPIIHLPRIRFDESVAVGNIYRIENRVLLGFTSQVQRDQPGHVLNVPSLPAELWGETNYITSIANEAFQNRQIGSFTIPSTVTSIGNSAFAGNSLTTITIPNSVTHIGDNAFANNNLSSVNFGNGIVRIENSVFSGNSIVNLAIPTTVTHIGDNAFFNSLPRTISIGSNVLIVNSAFSRTVQVRVEGGTRNEIRSIAFIEAYRNNQRRGGTYNRESSGGWSYFQETDHNEVRRIVQQRDEEIRRIRRQRQDEFNVKQRVRRYFMLGTMFMFGSPKFEVEIPEVGEKGYWIWGFEGGIFIPLFPHLYTGIEGRWGYKNLIDLETQSGESHQNEQVYFTSFAPTLGTVIPWGEMGKLCLGVMYEFGAFNSNYHTDRFQGVYGIDVTLTHGFYIRYRATLLENGEIANSISVGIGF